MAKHINIIYGEIKEMFTATAILRTINEYTMQLERETNECRKEYNTLIGAIVNSQKGLLQPYITPGKIIYKKNEGKAG